MTKGGGSTGINYVTQLVELYLHFSILLRDVVLKRRGILIYHTTSKIYLKKTYTFSVT
jgi:hypothetical protein